MGCFFPCFGTSKDKKRQQSANISPPEANQKHEVQEALKLHESINQAISEIPIKNIEEANQKHEVQEALKLHESINQAISEIPIKNIEESKESLEEKLDCNDKKKVTFDSSVKERETVVREEQKGANEKPPDSISSINVSYPPNYRYKNCRDSDEECDDLETEGGDLGSNGEEDQKLVQEESSESSLFSLSIDSRRRVVRPELGENEVNSPMPIHGSTPQELKTIESNPIARNARSYKYVYSVLNPVENLNKWQSIKEKAAPTLKDQLKENINLDEEFSIPFSSKPNSNTPKGEKHEVAVDTSLSSWLVESETTPMSKTSTVSVGNSGSERERSPMSLEDKPILGALTVEEIRKYSATASPSPRRKSPLSEMTSSPDDIPIIGSVGSYWRKTGQGIDSDSGSSCKNLPSTTSQYREDMKVKLQSTPFETRLERSLERGITEV